MKKTQLGQGSPVTVTAKGGQQSAQQSELAAKAARVILNVAKITVEAIQADPTGIGNIITTLLGALLDQIDLAQTNKSQMQLMSKMAEILRLEEENLRETQAAHKEQNANHFEQNELIGLKLQAIPLEIAGQLKLADFGLAALKTESRSKEYVTNTGANRLGPKGSLLWLAPELFRLNGMRSPVTDIFSLGVVLWELASHLYPYESAAGNDSLIRDWVKEGEREAFDERTPNAPKEYIEITQRC